jgi:hypothetical protein
MVTTFKGGRERDQENPLTQGPLLLQQHNLSLVLFIVEDWDIFEFAYFVTFLYSIINSTSHVYLFCLVHR